MNVLFLTVYRINSIEERNIYSDLLRSFRNKGHQVYIVTPTERRYNGKTQVNIERESHVLKVRIPDFQKTNHFEKLISTLLLPLLFKRAINQHFPGIQFDLVLYSTPPITFTSLIRWLKRKHKSKTYLLLKDIFPQNAIDLGFISKRNPVYWYFRRKEKNLYKVSDSIGCMSPANVDYVKKQNPWLNEATIEVCPNSIEPLIILITEMRKQEIRKKYQLPESKTIFLFGGNLGKPQGIVFMLDAIRFCENRSDAFFLVVGVGTELKRIQKWQNSHQPVNFKLMSELPRHEFDYIQQSADVGLIFLDKRFTIPNFPSRLLSHLECAQPIIAATDVHTDLGQIITKNGFGLWCEHGDVESFCENVNTFVSDQGKLRGMGQKGRLFLEVNYHVDKAYGIIMKHFA